MGAKSTRDLIVEAADGLFYRKGFESTSFSDIAEAVNISRGNFYYHFKTKDQILDAVIDARLAQKTTMMEQWEVAGETPVDRIRSFINLLVANKREIEQYGCPVGTLCTELAKIDHSAQPDANRIMTLFRTWLRRQFELLGRSDADQLAMHVLSRSQGASTLASSVGDEAFIQYEVQQMHKWLDQVAEGAETAPPPTRH